MFLSRVQTPSVVPARGGAIAAGIVLWARQRRSWDRRLIIFAGYLYRERGK